MITMDPRTRHIPVVLCTGARLWSLPHPRLRHALQPTVPTLRSPLMREFNLVDQGFDPLDDATEVRSLQRLSLSLMHLTGL